MRKLLCVAAAVALAAMPSTARAQAAPVALVVRVQGSVQVKHGSGNPAAAAVGDRLSVGDQVIPASGARAILITRTGAQQVVTSDFTVPKPPAGGNTDLFDRAVQTLAMAASSNARTAGGRQGMIRPVPGEPTIVAPRNGLTVSSNRPTFEWGAVKGAGKYTVQIRRLGGGRPVRYEVGKVHSWTLPAGDPGLIPGATYAWTVAPDNSGRAAREQRFKVIGPDEYQSLAKTLDRVAKAGFDPAGDGLFLTATVYTDLKLFYDARAALNAVEKQGAMNADAYMLKGEVLNELGHADQARKAFDRADQLLGR